MRNRLIPFGSILIFLFLSQCGPASSHYPSYEGAIAKYAPQGKYESVRVDDPDMCPSTPSCDCPRIWYHDHWIYYYGHHWMYWHHGHWYYYPYIYVYYHGGMPYIYSRPTLNVSMGGGPRGSGRPAGVHNPNRRPIHGVDPARPQPRRPTATPVRPRPSRPSGTHKRAAPAPAIPVRSAPPPQKAPAPAPRRSKKQP